MNVVNEMTISSMIFNRSFKLISTSSKLAERRLHYFHTVVSLRGKFLTRSFLPETFFFVLLLLLRSYFYFGPLFFAFVFLTISMAPTEISTLSECPKTAFKPRATPPSVRDAECSLNQAKSSRRTIRVSHDVA